MASVTFVDDDGQTVRLGSVSDADLNDARERLDEERDRRDIAGVRMTKRKPTLADIEEYW